ncbi:glycosyltransferase family 4 protein, partial [Vibrio parahaemolyticus]|nr:glycosyltransferase family 4 protein [Vibrio parahaemolyticus]
SLSPEDKDILIDIKKRGKILGTACLFNRRKGLDQVISALPRLPQCHFVIVGEGPERDSLEELAENLGVSDRVHFLGFRNDPAPLFKYFDIYMMPSREEGFGLALSEAILHGVPAVCSDIPIFRETFTSNEVSFFEIESTSSLVSAVIVALENHDSLSNLGSEKVKSHYLQSIMLKNHLSLYRK